MHKINIAPCSLKLSIQNIDFLALILNMFKNISLKFNNGKRKTMSQFGKIIYMKEANKEISKEWILGFIFGLKSTISLWYCITDYPKLSCHFKIHNIVIKRLLEKNLSAKSRWNILFETFSEWSHWVFNGIIREYFHIFPETLTKVMLELP